jgi:hypothetical protein
MQALRWPPGRKDLSVKLKRREFLFGSAAAVASLAVPSVNAEERPCREQVPDSFPVDARDRPLSEILKPLGCREQLLMPHAALRELQLGRVLPAGWLKEELTTQLTKLAIPQSNFCFPFDRRYWASNERGQDQESRNGGTSWYPWEQMGYWTDGAYRCAALLEEGHLLRRAREPISYTVEHPVEGWFLGPRKLYDPPTKTDPDEDPGRWPLAVFFRALSAAAEAENDSNIVNAMCRHYLEDTRSDYQHGPFGPRDRVNIESILWCYAHSGDARLLKKAEDIWSVVSGPELAALTVDQPSRMHGVTFAEVSKLAAILYLYTGERGLLDVSAAAMRRVFKYHMLPDGTPSTTEGLAGTSSLDGHETCDIVEFNLSWGYLLMATGDGMYGDRIERALFNAGMGAVRKDWSGLQYISCPNQLHIASNSCQVGHKGTAAALYGPNSDHRPKYKFVTACCAGNVNRMLPTYVQRMWMSSFDEGLAAVLYGPSRVRTKIAGASIEIAEKTDYPFSEQIELKIRSDKPVTFPLHLRIPAWCTRPEIKINGAPSPLSEITNGFAVIHRKYSDRDTLVLTLPMSTSGGRSSDGGFFLERGPLVYALQPAEKWRAIFMPEFEITSPDCFPMWAASASSPWNYGLAVDDRTPLDNQVRVSDKGATKHPWLNPPITLEVAGRRIEGWNLQQRRGSDPDWFQTPTLPLSKDRLGPVERITLVPLGCTHLRLSVFPLVPSS